ncbi:MAG TPA: PTS sugar transporter subunit IIC, partial [Acholeplasma sp.]
MCAAVVGCTAQMVGFSIQTIRKNDIGTIFTIGLASSMFQFKNVMKKPMTWVPTLIASFVLAPLCYVIFDGYQWFIDGAITNASPQLWPGMGSSGLVGQLLTLSTANFSGTAWLFVGAQIVFPALLVFGLDVLFIKMKWYSEDDLILDTTL